jgi:hypothetical protein
MTRKIFNSGTTSKRAFKSFNSTGQQPTLPVSAFGFKTRSPIGNAAPASPGKVRSIAIEEEKKAALAVKAGLEPAPTERPSTTPGSTFGDIMKNFRASRSYR